MQTGNYSSLFESVGIYSGARGKHSLSLNTTSFCIGALGVFSFLCVLRLLSTIFDYVVHGVVIGHGGVITVPLVSSTEIHCAMT